MARRQSHKSNIRNLQRSHGTYYVTLPIELVRQLGWKSRQKVTVKLSGKRLIIEDLK